MVPILNNNDVSEPSYNDSKFKVQNHNYIRTNLVTLRYRLIYISKKLYIVFAQVSKASVFFPHNSG